MERPSMTVIRVSQQELDRFKVLVELGDGRLGIDAAATLLGVGRRQLFRLQKAFKAKVPRAWCRASAAGPAIAPMARRCAGR